MSKIAVAAFAVAASLSSAASATDYLYTFDGVVTDAVNFDALSVYANVGDAIVFKLLVRDNLPTVAYSLSSAVGGPDHVPGSVFPVDFVITDPATGSEGVFDPLTSGVDPAAEYNASVTKDEAAQSLSIQSSFYAYYPPDPFCTDHCGGATQTNAIQIQVASAQFGSPDFRETGQFDLTTASSGTFTEGYAAYPGPVGDYYQFSFSHLAVSAIGAAVPEPASWGLIVVGFGLAGATLRRGRAIIRFT